MSIRTCFALCGLLLLGAASVPCPGQEAKPAPAKPQPATLDARSEDRTAVREAITSFAKSFEARDAAALAAYFTADGEFQTVQGLVLRGREALERAFAGFFGQTPEVTAQVRPEALRFLSKDSAIDEGIMTIGRGLAPPATARYTALLLREDGKWRLAMLSESPVLESVEIADLGWLVGRWRSTAGGGAEIQATYAWDAGKKFIRVQYALKEADLALSGAQVIGLDPATGTIHSWTFEADGGIGEADWFRDGDHWVLDAAGTLADGRGLTETNVLRRIDDDTFTWQSVNRVLGDEVLPDLPPVKVTRIKSGQ